MSSTESKYQAMSSASFEIKWLCRLLGELSVPQLTLTPLHADNTSAIQITANPLFHERTKHIEVDCQEITLPHISSEHQTIDVFTKALSHSRHQFLINKLLLRDRPTSI